MTDWWSAIGETSAFVGSSLGLIWALISTARRRQLCIRAGVPPLGQLRWFAVSFTSMGSYLTLVTALGLSSLNGLLPQPLFWYLLGLSAAAFSAALLFPAMPPSVQPPALERSQVPPADPPIMPLQKSA